MAKRAFSHCADDYAAHRPDYPAALLEHLSTSFGPPAGKRAVDVGAGTGIFSRQLAACGWTVIAADADPAMLAQLAEDMPSMIRRVAAPAEHLPIAASSIDLVSAAQAFHWFNPPVALAEFARVLRPGGGLALVWNNRDATKSDFLRAYDELIQRFNPTYRREYREQDWPAKIEASGAFTGIVRHTWDRVWQMPGDAFVAYTRTVSYIRNVLSAESRREFETALEALIARWFGMDPCEIPLRTDAWTAVRSAAPAVPARTSPANA